MPVFLAASLYEVQKGCTRTLKGVRRVENGKMKEFEERDCMVEERERSRSGLVVSHRGLRDRLPNGRPRASA